MQRKQSAFTLVELLVSTTILVLIMVILLQMTGATASTWRNGAAKAEQFQEARRAFETVTRRISEATLNTYWDYYTPFGSAAGTPPTDYVRQSDLRFRVVNMSGPDYSNQAVYRPGQGIFFQAPIGMVEQTDSSLAQLDDLLNSWGYFVEVDTTSQVPHFLQENYPKRTRARLMEFRQPSEEFDLYSRLYTKLKPQLSNLKDGQVPERDPRPSDTTGKVDASDDAWFTDALKLEPTNDKRRTRVLAENIVAMVILPRLSPTDEQARVKKAAEQGGTAASNKNFQKDRLLLTPDFAYHSKQLTNYVGNPTGATPDTAFRPDHDPELNPKNQLPPVVQVAMFAIDEISAQKLAETKRTSDLGLQEMIEKPTTGKQLFLDATKLESDKDGKDGDLKRFEDALVALKLNYRLFQTNVALRGAKWSRAQIK